jgi:hypothetical protein
MGFADIKASEGTKKEFDALPLGRHQARVTQIVHLGTQDGGQYDDQDKVYIRFEVPSHTTEVNGKQVPKMSHTGFGINLVRGGGDKPSNLGLVIKDVTGIDITDETVSMSEALSAFLGSATSIKQIASKKGEGSFLDFAATEKGDTSTPEVDSALILTDYTEKPDVEGLGKLSNFVLKKILNSVNTDKAGKAMKAAATKIIADRKAEFEKNKK